MAKQKVEVPLQATMEREYLCLFVDSASQPMTRVAIATITIDSIFRRTGESRINLVLKNGGITTVSTQELDAAKFATTFEAAIAWVQSDLPPSSNPAAGHSGETATT
jgi:hypothetical protein